METIKGTKVAATKLQGLLWHPRRELKIQPASLSLFSLSWSQKKKKERKETALRNNLFLCKLLPESERISQGFCASPFTWPGEKKLIPLEPVLPHTTSAEKVGWETPKRGEENSRGLQVRRAARSHQGVPLSLADNCCIWHFNGNWGRAGGRARRRGRRESA